MEEVTPRWLRPVFGLPPIEEYRMTDDVKTPAPDRLPDDLPPLKDTDDEADDQPPDEGTDDVEVAEPQSEGE